MVVLWAHSSIATATGWKRAPPRADPFTGKSSTVMTARRKQTLGGRNAHKRRKRILKALQTSTSKRRYDKPRYVPGADIHGTQLHKFPLEPRLAAPLHRMLCGERRGHLRVAHPYVGMPHKACAWPAGIATPCRCAASLARPDALIGAAGNSDKGTQRSLGAGLRA